ncbi:MAG TPA: ABC transporter permease subunit, partial [Spirochaetia bacterium]|nr:ABC transporter permease subunit [Spirochaetia bacterium]
MKAFGEFVKKHYSKLLTLVGFLVIWQGTVSLLHIKAYIIPSPVVTFSRLLVPSIAKEYHWLSHIQATVTEILASFAATAILGIFTAILITWSKFLRGLITPFLTLFNSLPKIALAPLFLLWFGYGIVPNIIIAVLIAFFPVVVNTS